MVALWLPLLRPLRQGPAVLREPLVLVLVLVQRKPNSVSCEAGQADSCKPSALDIEQLD
jgi:hypothetical protein